MEPNVEAHIAALAESKHRPVWFESDDMLEPLPPLNGDATCELLIIGGGFTGLWAALQAKERMPDLNIILVEQTFVGDGASGRNGGFLSSSLTHGETNGDYHFPGEAEQLYELGQQNMKEFIETLERYNIDAEYEAVGSTSVATNDAMVAQLRKEYEASKAAGDDVVWFDRDDMRRQVNSPTYLAGVWWRDGQDGVVHPAKLCWGLKKTILSLGVRIFEGTPVNNIAEDGDGMRSTCDSGNVHSGKILMATNAFPGLLPQMRRQVIPVWDYQIA
ncbi:MAG: FAD-dependent oxidoreductase, partial [Rhodospirillales bacterium]|nr:FAD-dependent oxidoreductase [Rhodospirillales bacterium]